MPHASSSAGSVRSTDCWAQVAGAGVDHQLAHRGARPRELPLFSQHREEGGAGGAVDRGGGGGGAAHVKAEAQDRAPPAAEVKAEGGAGEVKADRFDAYNHAPHFPASVTAGAGGDPATPLASRVDVAELRVDRAVECTRPGGTVERGRIVRVSETEGMAFVVFDGSAIPKAELLEDLRPLPPTPKAGMELKAGQYNGI
eukprot:gene25518-54555_t